MVLVVLEIEEQVMSRCTLSKEQTNDESIRIYIEKLKNII